MIRDADYGRWLWMMMDDDDDDDDDDDADGDDDDDGDDGDDDDDDDDDGGDDGHLRKKWNMNRFSAWQSYLIDNLLTRFLSICTFSILFSTCTFFCFSYLHKAELC